jgi:hypothetical protein
LAGTTLPGPGTILKFQILNSEISNLELLLLFPPIVFMSGRDGAAQPGCGGHSEISNLELLLLFPPIVFMSGRDGAAQPGPGTILKFQILNSEISKLELRLLFPPIVFTSGRDGAAQPACGGYSEISNLKLLCSFAPLPCHS